MSECNKKELKATQLSESRETKTEILLYTYTYLYI